ncbi:CYTH domain-containing protein [Epibacterium sp. MM17-32]|uniref:CYTH domain-containing protein n=1 Tax=Epibacterium sp. MM17-32 TaxID=2917734 RepID=UPI001EF4B0BC|nr:CYTH domain-containing protein [Epibacterium sp. MM17-32]MCG7627900.1 CYTH domain-containing protein [Epibacterium sp. MM17-32]
MKEIERKFLVADQPDLTAAQATPVRQGYLTALEDSTELRLRQKGERFFLTQKGGSGRVREEREAEISPAVFETFWPGTMGRRVEKTRWTGALPDGQGYELDIFEGALAPLQMVEVEFSDEAAAEAFVPPSWFGHEVTEDKRFGNKSLAVHGLPSDPE